MELIGPLKYWELILKLTSCFKGYIIIAITEATQIGIHYLLNSKDQGKKVKCKLCTLLPNTS